MNRVVPLLLLLCLGLSSCSAGQPAARGPRAILHSQKAKSSELLRVAPAGSLELGEGGASDRDLPPSQRCLTRQMREDSLTWAYELCEDAPEGFWGVWPYSFEWRGCIHQVLSDQCGPAPRSRGPLTTEQLQAACDSEPITGANLTSCAWRHMATVHAAYRSELASWAAAPSRRGAR